MADEKPTEVPAASARKPVSEEEIKESFAGPSFHSNKIVATGLGAGIRLTFMEIHPGKVSAKFRTSVILSYPDALELSDLLVRQLKDLEPDLRRAKEEMLAEMAAAAKTAAVAPDVE